MDALHIGKGRLTLEDIERFLQGRRILLSPEARSRVEAAHRKVQELLEGGPAYGINTGVGKLATTRIPPDDLRAFSVNLLRSHAVGVGEPAPSEVVRLTLLLRTHLLLQGYSGVSWKTLMYLERFLNEDVIPVVPRWGSVGASGDLAPLAHIALTLMGEGEVWLQGRRTAAHHALEALGLPPWNPGPKEALALINGTSYSTAVLLVAFLEARNLMAWLPRITAVTFEALAALPGALDARALALRGFGVEEAGAEIRRLLERSAIPRDASRVQDAYSLRCTPQIHGVSQWFLEFLARGLEMEINAVTDNPLVFLDPPHVVSCGNFHGQSVALMADTLVVALAGLGLVSERRTFRILTPELSGDLPPFLAARPGVESGLMMVQVTQASLVGRLRDLAYPSSLSSLPTSGEQEDVVPMATNAAYRALEVVDVLRRILAIEFLTALQAVALREARQEFPAPAVGALLSWARGQGLALPFREDRIWATEMEQVASWLKAPPPAL